MNKIKYKWVNFLFFTKFFWKFSNPNSPVSVKKKSKICKNKKKLNAKIFAFLSSSYQWFTTSTVFFTKDYNEQIQTKSLIHLFSNSYLHQSESIIWLIPETLLTLQHSEWLPQTQCLIFLVGKIIFFCAPVVTW